MAMMVCLMNPGPQVSGFPFCVARSIVQCSELRSISGDIDAEGAPDNAWPEDGAENLPDQDDWPEGEAL